MNHSDLDFRKLTTLTQSWGLNIPSFGGDLVAVSYSSGGLWRF